MYLVHGVILFTKCLRTNSFSILKDWTLFKQPNLKESMLYFEYLLTFFVHALIQRFNLKILGAWHAKGALVTIANWLEDETSSVDMTLLFIEAWHPVTFFEFGYPRARGSIGAYLLQDPTTEQYSIWTPNKWTHLCFSYERKNQFIRMVKVSQCIGNNPRVVSYKVIQAPYSVYYSL